MSDLAVGPDTVVTVSYVLFDEDGEAVDRATKTEPLTYVHGYGQIVPGLEQNLAGMRAGESRTFDVAPADAFGERDDEAVFEVDKDGFPDSSSIEAGDEFVAEAADGGTIAMRVVEVRDETLLVDANHPLAGHTLRFEVEVDEVRAASDAEIDEAQAELEDDAELAGCCDHDHDGHDHHHHHHDGAGEAPRLVQLAKKS